jgi:hypothetical protein
LETTGRIDYWTVIIILSDFPDLKSGITLASFHSLGTHPLAREKFIIFVSGFAVISAESFRSRVGIASNPTAFLLFNLLS